MQHVSVEGLPLDEVPFLFFFNFTGGFCCEPRLLQMKKIFLEQELSLNRSSAFERGFDEKGPKFGSLYLLHKSGNVFELLSRGSLEAALSERFGETFDVTRTIEGLAAVARALNAGDVGLAAIATSRLHLPKPASSGDMAKASADDPRHPGWPAHTPDKHGGEFRPKEASVLPDTNLVSERAARIERLNARRGIRAMLRRVLTAKRLARLAWEAVGETIPILDAADTIALAEDIGEIASEIAGENAEIDAAKTFAEIGPHRLEELAVSTEENAFPSFDAFKKNDDLEKDDLEKRFGPAGDGYEYHHIVEQGSGAASQEQLQSTRNIIRIPKLLHEEVSAYYSRIEEGSVTTFRSSLKSLTFEEKRAAGLRVLQNLGVIH